MSEKEQIQATSINHIASDVMFNGNITFTDHLTVSGLVLGNMSSDNGILDITKQGIIEGEIKIDTLNNKGKISGSVEANIANLFQKSICKADLTIKEIMIERHTKMSGRIQMPQE